MPAQARIPRAVTDNAVPIAVALGSALLFRRLLGTVLSIAAMFTIGRMLLTALKIDLALAERRDRTSPRRRSAADAQPGSAAP